MSLQDRLREDLNKALRAEDRVARSTLRLCLSAVHNAEIAQQKKLDDEGVIAVLSREAKQRKESIEAFQKGNRQDLVDQEQAELKVILGYLPQPLTRDEIIEMAKKIISETGARSPQDKGKLMARLMPLVRGKADGQEVNAIVMELLSG